jgi:hypothetical protein
MRDRAVVVAQALFRLLEVAAENVGEIVEIHLGVGIEGIDVVERDEARRHVPFMRARLFVRLFDIRLRLVIGAEQFDVLIGIGIADRFIGIEAHCLMRPDRPGNFLVDVRLQELRAPIAVIAADEAQYGDVVEKAGGDDRLAHAALQRMGRALQQMIGGSKTQAEEIGERRFRRHFLQPRILAHHHVLAGLQGLEARRQRLGRIALTRGEQHRGIDDAAELGDHRMLEIVGALGHAGRGRALLSIHRPILAQAAPGDKIAA